MIYGIGRVYASALEAAGLATWEDLLGCEPEAVSDLLRAAGYRSVTAREASFWRQHARSYQTAAPVVFGLSTRFPAGDSFIALDLEYGSHIWLAGACVVTGDTREYVALWADDAAAEEANLALLGELVRAHPDLPVLTWAGNSADIPRLRTAANKSLRAEAALEELFRRHADVFVFARSHVRLPIPGLGLKEVAEYFGMPRIAGITDGLQAQLLYARYRQTGDTALRDRLTDYNRDDLDSLIAVIQRLGSLVRDASWPSPDSGHAA
jgi:predicted RecB family nuclease